MLISHVAIIADSALCLNAILGAIWGVMGSTLEINFIFPYIHILFLYKPVTKLSGLYKFFLKVCLFKIFFKFLSKVHSSYWP